MNEALREAFGGQPALFLECVQHGFDLGRIFGVSSQLARQFFARVFAPRQIAHRTHLQRRPFAGLRRIAGGATIAGCGAAIARGAALFRAAVPLISLAFRRVRVPFAARVGCAAQALRLGDRFEFVVQLGA